MPKRDRVYWGVMAVAITLILSIIWFYLLKPLLPHVHHADCLHACMFCGGLIEIPILIGIATWITKRIAKWRGTKTDCECKDCSLHSNETSGGV